MSLYSYHISVAKFELHYMESSARVGLPWLRNVIDTHFERNETQIVDLYVLAGFKMEPK